MNKTQLLVSLFLVVACFCVTNAQAQWTETNIAYAKRDISPQDYYPDDTTTSYQVEGRVTSVSFSTNDTSFFIQDTNDNVGIQVFRQGYITNYTLGVQIFARGLISQYNGLRRINPELSGHVGVVDPTVITVDPVPGTISTFMADPESYEGTFVIISNVNIESGSWPPYGDSDSLTITDATGSLTLRIDESTDIDGQLEPTNTFHLQGIFSQYDTSPAANSGYQVLPRYYTDIEQLVGQAPPFIYVIDSNTYSVATGQVLTVSLLGLDRNATDTLVISTNDAPAGSAVANLPMREAQFTWTPDVSYAGTTNKIILEITDGTETNTVGLDVFVLSEALANIRLNEMQWDPAGDRTGDANGDGVREAVGDEFIEIINNNDSADVDMTGWEFRYGSQVYFTFPTTILTAKTAIVVFGGGVPVGAFGGSVVHTSGWNGIGSSTPVSLWTDDGAQIFTFDQSGFGNPNMSATRDPDMTGGFVLSDTVVDFLLYTPGTMADGKYFSGTGETNSPPVLAPLADQSVGVGAAWQLGLQATDPEGNPIGITVSNAPATASLVDNGDGTATLSYTGVVGDAGSTFPITAYAGDDMTNSTKGFDLDVRSLQYEGLIINEFCADPAPDFDANNDGVVDSGEDEYVEIVNMTTGAVDMAGFMIYDAAGKKFTFDTVIVPSGGCVVAFGGGSLSNFEYPPAQTGSGYLGLGSSSPESVILYSPETNEVDRYDYPPPLFTMPDSKSWTRYPDVTGGWTNHYVVTTNTLRGSPGRMVHGQPFLPNLPALSITNPVGVSTTVPNAIATYDISGTANTSTIGQVVWTNDLTGGVGTAPAATSWVISAVSLDVGDNEITVTGTNTTGSSISRSVTITRAPLVLSPPVIQPATGVTTNAFDANWDASSGATGYLLDVATNVSFSPGAGGDAVWVNEFHYDNSGGDLNEFVEIAGTAEIDLSTYTLLLYNGNGGGVYGSNDLSGTIPDEGCGFGAVAFLTLGLQNGAPDGFALIKNDTTVVQFLSYEGSFTATDGAANGMTSTDVGVSESSATLSYESLQLFGTGDQYNAFTWTGPLTNSMNLLNANQEISPCGGGGSTFVPGYQNRDVGNVITFGVTGLTQGVTYYYRVRAYSVGSTSAYSSVTSVVTQASGPIDTDGDGMPDYWEEIWFTNKTAGVASADDDSDWIFNLGEYLADTIPNGPAGPTSYFAIVDMTNFTGRFVEFVSSTGRIYTIQASDLLDDGGSWSNLQVDVPGLGGTMSLGDTNDSEFENYRLRVRVPFP